ncbi:transglycosylase domain-containing protein [Rhodococcus antarcticus]
MLGVCVLAGVLVAGVLFPAVGGLGLLSNQASATVDSVSSEIGTGLVPQTTVMLDKNGGTIATLWGDQRRTVVTGDQISTAMKAAIVSIEDKRFYEHAGVDYRGTARAFLSNASGNATQGASTLTQQYVKNYLLLVLATTDAERRQATETTPARKLREIRIALAVDKELGKDEILTRYLNLVPFGNGAYGIQAAAQTYFGINAVDLTVPQSAMLAGMVQSSSALNPYTNVQGVTDRRNTVLDTMRDNAIITASDADTLKATPLGVLADPGSPTNGCLGAGDSGFFCDYALSYLNGLNLKKADLGRGGYVIRTTLDPVVQASVKSAVNVDVPADRPNVANVMDVVQPGQDKHRVVAMASSRTYGFTANTAQTVQPMTYTPVGDGAGSVFKVFTTAAAMEQGMGTNAVLQTPNRIEVKGFGVGGAEGCPADSYCVQNYNGNYKPSYSITDALAQSPNTGFVDLITKVGVTPTVDMAVKLGMRSLATPASAPIEANPQRSVADKVKAENSASFTLGVNQVNMVELSNVGATLASSGMWCPPSPIESVTESTGAPVDIGEQACAQVVAPGLANTLTVALSQDDVNGTSANAARQVGWGYPTSGKTGTTNGYKSAAFLGFTNTLAGANIVFDDSPAPKGIRVAGFSPSSCGNLECGNITGGTTPAHTFYTALKPVIDAYGPVALPPTDPAFVNGSSTGNVPSVVGQDVTEATAALQALKFQVRQSTVTSGAARGTVLRQSVTGASVPGATVTLYASSGRSPVVQNPAPTADPPVQPAPVDPNAPPGQGGDAPPGPGGAGPPGQQNPNAPPA